MFRSIALTLTLVGLITGLTTAVAGDKSEKNLAHMVYFKLKDNSADAKQKLVAACQKYLSGHEGEVYFSAGSLAEDLKREVNDRDFDVSLNIVFKDRACQDKYQDHARHHQFIDENKSNWSKVRVFDSYVSGK